jgi:O-methyltransferase
MREWFTFGLISSVPSEGKCRLKAFVMERDHSVGGAAVAVNQSAPRQSWRWLRPFLPKRLQPGLRGLLKRYRRLFLKLDEPYRSVYPFIQAHPVRQQNLVRLGECVVKENILGAVVECGVLDGGAAALMAWATRAASPARPVHLFDAWEGLPETTAEDGTDAAIWTGQVVGSPTRVVAAMKTLDVDRERINFHRGWFNDTFPKVNVPQVALAHIDCDFYDPTQLCLEKWYPALSPGGFMQFDDYGAFLGCRKAVDEFLAVHPELKIQTAGESTQAYFIEKPR